MHLFLKSFFDKSFFTIFSDFINNIRVARDFLGGPKIYSLPASRIGVKVSHDRVLFALCFSKHKIKKY